MRRLLAAALAALLAAPPVPAAVVRSAVDASARAPARPSRDYARMFELSRRTLAIPHARRFLRETFADELTLTEEQQAEHALPDRIKEMSESQFMLLLQHNPQAWPMLEEYLAEVEKDEEDGRTKESLHAAWRDRFRLLAANERIREVFRTLNDPLSPMHLEAEDGAPGYGNARVYANHRTKAGRRTAAPADLKAVLTGFIGAAETELMFNVFDFDLEDVADAMIARADAGVKVTGGVDKNVVEARPAVKAVFDRLSKHPNITMRAVDPVGLNHQKLVVRDWNDPEKAASLFSSGNFTQSCIGPEGDLKGLPAGERPKDSIPNANHMLVMDGQVMALTAANSLIKTLVLGLRGDEYPLGGAYKVFGAGPKDEAPWMIAAFSPKGGLGDINRDMTRRLLLSTRGPVRALQFAFSAKSAEEALVERARLEKEEGGAFDFKSVGDTPFAMRPWSVFLSLSGLVLEEAPKRFVEAGENALRAVLGPGRYEALRRDIRVGPRAYRTHWHTAADGTRTEYGAKIHHKVLISGAYAILGTSFNFSEAANSNQEQFLVTGDAGLVAAMNAVFDGLFAATRMSVLAEARRRNAFMRKGAEAGDDELKVGDLYEHVDEEAARSRRG